MNWPPKQFTIKPDTQCPSCHRHLILPPGADQCATCVWYESWMPREGWYVPGWVPQAEDASHA